MHAENMAAAPRALSCFNHASGDVSDAGRARAVCAIITRGRAGPAALSGLAVLKVRGTTSRETGVGMVVKIAAACASLAAAIWAVRILRGAFIRH